MSLHICINTDKSLHQLATEIRKLLSLPPFQETIDVSYCQFEMLGFMAVVRKLDDEDREPEVRHFPFSFDMQLTFGDHELDTDMMEYQLQPYYAQLLTFHLGVETAYREQKKTERSWQVRFHFCRKNQNWTGSLLFGEAGYEPSVLDVTPGSWRS